MILTGHSRNGKAALIAAAHDERFAGIVSSSAGVMGAIPARLCCNRHSGEGIELLTRVYPDWYHPRLRFFSGREQRLPTDAHELLALVAPWPLLLSVAVNDPVESTWAAERTEESVRGVYELLGAPDNLALRWRPGGHRLEPAAFERHLDWCDAAIGRAPAPAAQERRLHPRGWLPWARPAAGAAAPQVTLDLSALRGELVAWLGASTAPSVPPRGARRAAHERRSGERGRAERSVPGGIAQLRTSTSDGVDVHVYLLAVRASTRPLPLWLAPLCRAAGYVAGYDQGVPLLESLARKGWAVACHDPLGTGGRPGEEAEVGHGPFPLARMVHDAARVVSAAQALAPVSGAPAWIAGYGAGAMVGLHLAALDPGVAGGAFVAPLSGDPLLPEEPPGHGLADLLAAFGARPGLVLRPRWDPEGARGHVAASARAAASVGAAVEHRTVADYHRLSADPRTLVVAWLDQAARGASRAAA